jgi:hypothetical protein
MDFYEYRNSLYFTIDPKDPTSIDNVYEYLINIKEDINRIMVIGGNYTMIHLDTVNSKNHIDTFEKWINTTNIKLLLPLLLVKVDTNSYHYNEDTYEVFGDDSENVVYIVGNFVMYEEDFNRTKFLILLENHNVNILYTDNGEYKISRLYCTIKEDIGKDHIKHIRDLFPDVVVLFRSKVIPCQ